MLPGQACQEIRPGCLHTVLPLVTEGLHGSPSSDAGQVTCMQGAQLGRNKVEDQDTRAARDAATPGVHNSSSIPALTSPGSAQSELWGGQQGTHCNEHTCIAVMLGAEHDTQVSTFVSAATPRSASRHGVGSGTQVCQQMGQAHPFQASLFPL